MQGLAGGETKILRVYMICLCTPGEAEAPLFNAADSFVQTALFLHSRTLSPTVLMGSTVFWTQSSLTSLTGQCVGTRTPPIAS